MSTDATQTSGRNELFTYRRCIAATAAGGLGLTLIGAGLTSIFLIAFGPQASGTTTAVSRWTGETAAPRPPEPVRPAPASQAPLEQVPLEQASLEQVSLEQVSLEDERDSAAATEQALATEGTSAAASDLDESIPPAPDLARTISIDRGDTLMAALVKAGADRRDAHAAISALATVYNPRHLQPGQELTLTFEQPEDDTEPRLKDVSLTASVELDVIARRNDDGGFVAQEVEKVLQSSFRRAEGRIDTSLYLAAVDAGVPVPVLSELIRIFSYDVDFQRDVQPGDSFGVFYESLLDETGAVAKHGEIEFARLTLSGKELALYRFELPDGTVDYFNDKGESVRKALMKTPIDGARLSSGYGMRRHPILGYSRMHKGTDFAAPSGTPIMAAGDGVVEVAGRNGAYGKYVRIRHNSRYKTAYAHMSRFGRGIRSGSRVTQGQIIGYVGSTGRSTGPHLHYEVLVSGRQVNPMGLNLPTGKKLEGKQLAAFQDARRALETRMAEAPLVRQMAQESRPLASQ